MTYEAAYAKYKKKGFTDVQAAAFARAAVEKAKA